MSRSLCEAEYRSLAATVYKLLWISYILRYLKIKTNIPVDLLCDNKEIMHIIENPIFHERTHLDIDFHILRDQYKLGFVQPKHVSTKQVVDLFTKALCGLQFQNLVSMLNLQDIHHGST